MQEEEDGSRELQLLSKPFSSSLKQRASIARSPNHPSLDLTLSIDVGAFEPPSDQTNVKGIQALRWHATEQIRLAALEKAYAEQVKELAKREREMAEEEFARARLVWERAREEVEKVEKMKEMAIRRVSSTCAEITCRACQQRFRTCMKSNN